MSGLAAVLAGRTAAGVHAWHGAFDAVEVRASVEHAGWAFAHLDGWTGLDGKAEFLAAMGAAWGFPDWYGHNFDALADCLRDVGAQAHGAVLLWDGWSTFARADAAAFEVTMSILRERAADTERAPFEVLLRGEGPEVRGLLSLD